MNKFLKVTWTIARKTAVNFFHGDCVSHASSIAFYTIFSLPAILIIALSIGSAFYERNVVQQELLNQVGKLIGPDSAKEIESILLHAVVDSTSALAKIIGIATLIFSATTVFISLQTSLNSIWGIKPKPQRGYVKYIVNRLLSLTMVISIGFVLLVSLVVDAVLVIFQGMLAHALAGLTFYVIRIVNFVFSTGFITIIFAMLFKVLPDATVRWKDVWVGSLVTTLLFTFGKYLIGFYLGNSDFNSAYGAAGSLVIILVWMYYSTVIFLFGAELTFVYAREMGSEIRPYSNAVRVETIEIEN
jgi:membrane protein